MSAGPATTQGQSARERPLSVTDDGESIGRTMETSL